MKRARIVVSDTGGNRLTLQEAAEKIGVHPNTLRSHMNQGHIHRARPERDTFGKAPMDVFEKDLETFVHNYAAEYVTSDQAS